MQGSTIVVHRIHRYSQFYWRMHEFGHAYIDTYAHLFPMIFKFIFFFGSNNILFKTLLLYIWTLICLALEERLFSVYICFKETLFFQFAIKTVFQLRLRLFEGNLFRFGQYDHQWNFNISFCQISVLSFYLNKKELKTNC